MICMFIGLIHLLCVAFGFNGFIKEFVMLFLAGYLEIGLIDFLFGKECIRLLQGVGYAFGGQRTAGGNMAAQNGISLFQESVVVLVGISNLLKLQPP